MNLISSIRISGLSVSAAIISSCAGGAHTDAYRMIHNNDGTDLLGNLWCGARPLTVEDLDRNVDLVAESPVTTYMMCTGGDSFYHESDFGRIIGDDLGGTIPIGEDTAQFLSIRKFYFNYLRLKEQGVDFVGHCLERARSKGKETFITYRMNDLHFSSRDVCQLGRPAVFDEHPEWLIDDGDAQGWHSAGGLDFAIDEVRERKIAIVEEQLDRYGMLIDGFELDFLRFPVYFKPDAGPSHTALMTDMVKKIRHKVDSVAAAQGHRILLTVRVASSVEDNLKLGIDIKEWLRLGLVDFLTMGTYWRGDPSMPVRRFREQLGDCLNVPLYACVDDGGYTKREPWSQGQFRGMCSNVLAQGADGVYLFNFYFGAWGSSSEPDTLVENGGQVLRVPSPALLNELGTLKTLEGMNKIYLLSDGKKEFLLSPVTPLPISLASGESEDADIMVGDEPGTKLPSEVILFVRAEGPVDVRFNGNPLTTENPSYPALYDKVRNLEPECAVHAYIVDPVSLRNGFNRMTFASDSGAVVRRVELALKYGDVSECGYF